MLDAGLEDGSRVMRREWDEEPVSYTSSPSVSVGTSVLAVR